MGTSLLRWSRKNEKKNTERNTINDKSVLFDKIMTVLLISLQKWSFN